MAIDDCIDSLFLVRELLADPLLTPENLVQKVSERSNIPVERLLGKGRYQPMVFYRQAAYYLYRERFGLSFPEIARRTEREDHTSVMHGVRVVTGRLQRYQIDVENDKLRERSSIPSLRLVEEFEMDEQLSAHSLLPTFCQRSGIPPDQLLGKSKEEPLVFYREALYYLYWNKFGLSYRAISILTDRSSHATVMTGVRVVERRLELYHREERGKDYSTTT